MAPRGTSPAGTCAAVPAARSTALGHAAPHVERPYPATKGSHFMSLALASAAALSFALGGLLMKPAYGLSRPVPSLALFALFAVGTACLALSVHRGGEVGPAYLIVIGMEALLAFGLSVAIYGEPITAGRLAAVVLVLSGTAILGLSSPL